MQQVSNILMQNSIPILQSRCEMGNLWLSFAKDHWAVSLKFPQGRVRNISPHIQDYVISFLNHQSPPPVPENIKDFVFIANRNDSLVIPYSAIQNRSIPIFDSSIPLYQKYFSGITHGIEFSNQIDVFELAPISSYKFISNFLRDKSKTLNLISFSKLSSQWTCHIGSLFRRKNAPQTSNGTHVDIVDSASYFSVSSEQPSNKAFFVASLFEIKIGISNLSQNLPPDIEFPLSIKIEKERDELHRFFAQRIEKVFGNSCAIDVKFSGNFEPNGKPIFNITFNSSANLSDFVAAAENFSKINKP